MTMHAATSTDRYGFPVKVCTRCGGSGQHSFNPIDGTICYGCGGSGVQHATKKAKDAYTAFCEARRAANLPSLWDCKAGDTITWNADMASGRAWKGATWRTVARIEVTPVAASWSVHAAGTDHDRREVASTYVYVTYADGTTERRNGATLCARRGVTVDPAPYVMAATARTRRDGGY